MINNLHRSLACALIAALSISCGACGKESAKDYTPVDETNDTVYTISLCQDEDNDYYNHVALGFSDALEDLFGSDHILVTKTTATNESGTDAICADYVTAGTQLIFANGEKSLSSAATATTEIPVVGAAVMDYQTTLHIAASDSSWNRKTGTNVTGVSSRPNIEEQLSLLIEATPELHAVGLLYNPEDTDAIYQNTLIEKYLDQAGIPWKEYAVPSDYATASKDTPPIDTTAIEPTKQFAASATEGIDNDVESFDDSNLLDGIFAPNSAHIAKTSSSWTEDLSVLNTEPLAEDADLTTVITYACNECSALFIPAESQLSDEIATIADIATEAGVTTVGGDDTLGQETLVSLYKDPYAMGYAAGKLVYRILIDGDSPGDIKISNSSVESVKLYSTARAEALGMTFPKSFSEITDYFEAYEIGSTTSRVTSEEN